MRLGGGPDLDRAPSQRLLDGSLDRVRGPQPFLMALGQREDSETFGDVFLEPRRLFGRGVTIVGEDFCQGGFDRDKIIRRPDRFQRLADRLAGLAFGV